MSDLEIVSACIALESRIKELNSRTKLNFKLICERNIEIVNETAESTIICLQEYSSIIDLYRNFEIFAKGVEFGIGYKEII